MTGIIKNINNKSGLKKVRNFFVLYRAIFFILGLTAISMVGVVILFNRSNNTNFEFLTKTSIIKESKAFSDVETGTVNTLSAVLEGLLNNENIARRFAERQKRALLEITAPLFKQFKEQNGITHWYFILPGPGKRCFLRVHAPGICGDKITRATLDKCIATQRIAFGKELGKTAVAIRVVRPFFLSGKLIGYMELAVEIEHVLQTLKAKTGSQYGLLVKKEFMDQEKWRSVTKVKGLRNNWNDHKHFLLVHKTSKEIDLRLPTEALEHLRTIPDEGVVLEKLHRKNHYYVRGMFPFHDAAGHKAGGIFLLKDITGTFNAIKKQQMPTLIMLIGFMGAITFLMIFFHRRAERALRMYRGHLETVVRESTSELRKTNSKLNLEIDEHKRVRSALEEECNARAEAEKKQIQAIKQAERSARLASIGVMAAGITHEINQPLNAIKVSADSIHFWHKRNPGKLPDTFTDQLNIISRSVSRIVEIVQHMRAFWVVPDIPQEEEVKLNQAVTNALSLTRQQLHAHGIVANVDLGPDTLRIQGNLIHLEQIIINLTVNAINAMDEKNGNDKSLAISTWEDNKDKVFLSIEDTGPGLPTNNKEKIFDPFYSTRNGGEGMGLGLAIVKNYVDKYHGTIEVENKEVDGEITGACFTLSFPAFGGKE